MEFISGMAFSGVLVWFFSFLFLVVAAAKQAGNDKGVCGVHYGTASVIMYGMDERWR
jgi:hypothetical protein